MRIGLYLKRQDWHDPHVASDRIRGEWIMRHCSEMEEWKPGVVYDAVVFHNPVSEIIRSAAPVKILDVCDPMWGAMPDAFRRLIAPIDAIVTTTEAMRAKVAEITSKPVFVIGDGHYFPFYETREPNPQTRPAELAVWFGYADNAASLRPLLPALRACGLRLKVIAERHPFPGEPGVTFAPWSLDSFVREISLADFAVLPANKPYKSNNKDISALLCGIPVAKTETDIARLMDPAERRREMAAAPAAIARHDAKDRAREYRGLIQAIWEQKAVCGACA